MLRTLVLTVAAACTLALVGCEEGPSGVNPSLELTVLDENGVQVNFAANMMIDGSNVKQCQIPLDAQSGGSGSLGFSISNDGYVDRALRASNLSAYGDASLSLNFPLTMTGKGTYDIDSAGGTSVTLLLDGIFYKAVDGIVTLTDASTTTSGPFTMLRGAKGYLHATMTGTNNRIPSDKTVYTLTISSCVFDNMPPVN